MLQWPDRLTGCDVLNRDQACQVLALSLLGLRQRQQQEKSQSWKNCHMRYLELWVQEQKLKGRTQGAKKGG